MIYFDNAATTMVKPQCVVEAVTHALCHTGNAGRGAHKATLTTGSTILQTRQALCELFHGSCEEGVIFTQNATHALNIVLRGLFDPGDHVITTVMEHNSVLRPLYMEEKRGVSLTMIPTDEQGRLRCEMIEESITPQTKAVVCTHASNLTGNVNDLARIGQICRKYNILFIVDASQTAGVLPINMEEMNIDIVCFTGHKGLRGPQGTGGLCIREPMKLPTSIRPLTVGGTGIHSFDHEQPAFLPEALEAGTLNGHGIAGMHAALSYLKETGIDNIYEKEHQLAKTFYEGVRDIPGVKIYGTPWEEIHAPIVTINIEDYDSAEVADELQERFGICTRAGAHCAPLMHDALGTTVQGAVRFSFSVSNTMEEIRQGIEAIRILATEE